MLNHLHYSSAFKPRRNRVSIDIDNNNNVDSLVEETSSESSDNNNNSIESENESHYDSDGSEHSENKQQWPTVDDLKEHIFDLPQHNHSRLAYDSLWNSNNSNKFATVDCQPFRNEFDALSFFMYQNPELKITRNAMTLFIKIMRTIKKNGHLNENYWIPKSAQVIESRWKFFPTPPVR